MHTVWKKIYFTCIYHLLIAYKYKEKKIWAKVLLYLVHTSYLRTLSEVGYVGLQNWYLNKPK